jgi:hypothetical protein
MVLLISRGRNRLVVVQKGNFSLARSDHFLFGRICCAANLLRWSVAPFLVVGTSGDFDNLDACA